MRGVKARSSILRFFFRRQRTVYIDQGKEMGGSMARLTGWLTVGSLILISTAGPAAGAGWARAEAEAPHAPPHRVIATVPVGQVPVGVVVHPTRHKIYVSNRLGDTVSVIDGATNTVIKTIPVGRGPFYWMGVNPLTDRVYVANNAGGTVAVIDSANDVLAATVVGVDGAPEGIGVHPGRDRVYVTRGGRTLSVVDGASNQKIADVLTGASNHGVVVNPALDRAYISRSDPNVLTVFDLATNAWVADVPATGHPAIDPVTQRVYLADFRSPRMWMVSGLTNQVEGQIALANQPLLAAVDPVLGCVYASNPAAGRLTIIDIASSREIGTLPVGQVPAAVSVDLETGRVYVANEGSNTVTVIQGGPCGEGVAPSPTTSSTPSATLTRTSTPTPSATRTPTSTPSISPTPSDTPVPSDTPTTGPTWTPSATPTVTLTPWPSPSPTPVACVPVTRASDIALVLDASLSMEQANKLRDARAAILGFVDRALAPPDQLALVTFNAAAGVNQPLTTDKSRLRTVLQAVIAGAGTRIDLGLAAARGELAGPRHRPDSARVIILLSDGVQSSPPASTAVAEADAAKAAGMVVFTIALGGDADLALLAQLASSPDHAFVAPSGAELAAIYQRISLAIPCSSLGGQVFVDRDEDGRYDPAVDAPLPGVDLTLTGPVSRRTRSDAGAQGNYRFADIAGGRYVVALDPASLPPGLVLPMPPQRSVDLGAAPLTGVDFGLRRLPTATPAPPTRAPVVTVTATPTGSTPTTTPSPTATPTVAGMRVYMPRADG